MLSLHVQCILFVCAAFAFRNSFMTNFPDGRGVGGVAQSEIEREKQGDGPNLI